MLQVYFGFNFLAGFMLVCCILPIDLMVMSYMRYIRFQFEVLKNDLVYFFNVIFYVNWRVNKINTNLIKINLRVDSIMELSQNTKHKKTGNSKLYLNLFSQIRTSIL